MNGYSFKRIKDEELQDTLALAVGMDKDMPGFVLVDLVIPQYKGGYRFSATQFDMFAFQVEAAAKMAMTFAILMDCVTDSLDGEDDALAKRVMDKVSVYMADYARRFGGEEPEQNPEEEIPFSGLDADAEDLGL